MSKILNLIFLHLFTLFHKDYSSLIWIHAFSIVFIPDVYTFAYCKKKVQRACKSFNVGSQQNRCWQFAQLQYRPNYSAHSLGVGCLIKFFTFINSTITKHSKSLRVWWMCKQFIIITLKILPPILLQQIAPKTDEHLQICPLSLVPLDAMCAPI